MKKMVIIKYNHFLKAHKAFGEKKALTARFGNVSTGKSTDFKHIKALVVLFNHIKTMTENFLCL